MLVLVLVGLLEEQEAAGEVVVVVCLHKLVGAMAAVGQVHQTKWVSLLVVLQDQGASLGARIATQSPQQAKISGE